MPINALASTDRTPERRKRSGLSRFLASHRAWPWMLVDFALASSLFYSCALFGRMSRLKSVRADNLKAGLTLAFLFCLIGLATGLFERETRISRLRFFKTALITWGLA